MNFQNKGFSLSVIALLLAVFFWMFCVTTIEVGERAVVLRWGTYAGTLTEGLNFTLPIDHLIKFNVRDVHYDAKHETSSKDMQTITIKSTLVYALDPDMLDKVYRNYGTRYEAVVIRPPLAEIVNSVISKYAIENIVEKREEISTRILNDMRDKTRGSGVIIRSFYIVDHDFSDEYDRAIEQKKVAEQEALKARFVKEKSILESEAQAIKTKTLSPLVLLEQAIAKWDGHLPHYLSGGDFAAALDFKAMNEAK